MPDTTDTTNTPEVENTTENKQELPKIDPVIEKLTSQLQESQAKISEYEAKQKEIEEAENLKKEEQLKKKGDFEKLITEKDAKITELKSLEEELKELRQFKSDYDAKQEQIKNDLLLKIEDENVRNIFKDSSIEAINEYLKKTNTSVNSQDSRVPNYPKPQNVDYNKMNYNERLKYELDNAPIVPG